MSTKLYYTVEKQTQTIDTIEECIGWKNIQVYEIANDIPKLWFEIEARNDDYTNTQIKNWLDNNGFGDREYDMIWL